MLNCELYITVHTVAKGGRKLIISVLPDAGLGAPHLDSATSPSLSQYTWDRAQRDKEKWSMQSPPN